MQKNWFSFAYALVNWNRNPRSWDIQVDMNKANFESLTDLLKSTLRRF